jgi:HK97 family phage prohead protease
MSGRVIEGYAAIFNIPDKVNDTILPGAFKRTLGERKPDFRLDHFGGCAGEIIEAREDEEGLFVKARLDRDVGDIDGLSIGFVAQRTKRGKNWRKLYDVDLIEVSVCADPIHPLARFRDAPSIEQDDFAPRDAVKALAWVILGIVAGSYALAAWALAGWPSVWAFAVEAFPCAS